MSATLRSLDFIPDVLGSRCRVSKEGSVPGGSVHRGVKGARRSEESVQAALKVAGEMRWKEMDAFLRL